MNPIKLGITGGIGSGKTIISQLLQLMEVPVYLSDIEAKRLTITDCTIRQKLTELLGTEIYRGKELNKQLLTSYLFSSADHVLQINNIIHPEVKRDFRKWVNKHRSCPIVAMESAIIIEAGFRKEIDFMAMVYAPLDLRIRRTMQRDKTSYEAVSQRIQHQMNDEEKKEKADFVIYNDGLTPLIPQVISLLHQLSLP